MKKLHYIICMVLILTCLNYGVQKKSEKVFENISYKSGSNLADYEKERCKLDLYVPNGVKDFPVIVWFHGGSMKHESKDEAYTKEMARRFLTDGIAVAVVNYRLSPNVKNPAYIKDAASAVAWTQKNIRSYGGSPQSVFIAGHSAGGYLSLMLALVPDYLKDCGADYNSIAGIINVSGQTFTHYTVREEMGIHNPEMKPFIDKSAPCYNIRVDTPPILSVCGEYDNPDRIMENKYSQIMMNKIGNNKCSYHEAVGKNHMTLITKLPEKDDPLAKEILSFIGKYKNTGN